MSTETAGVVAGIVPIDIVAREQARIQNKIKANTKASRKDIHPTGIEKTIVENVKDL